MKMAWSLYVLVVLLMQQTGVEAATKDISTTPFLCQFMFFDPLCQNEGLTQLSNVGRHWKMFGAPESTLTGPQTPLKGRTNDDIMYANYDSPADGLGKEGDQEALVSPVITTNGPACVKFAYYMFGADLGKLYTVIKYSDAGGYDTFEPIDKLNPRRNTQVVEKLIAEGDKGKQWIRKNFQVAFSGQTKFQVFFQVMRGNGRLSNIGLDDIEITTDVTNCSIDSEDGTNPGPTGCSTNPCDTNAACKDLTAGGFECTCNTGYNGDGKACADTNECLTNPCSADATCTNTPGSFICACKIGFSGDGKVCNDINECLNNPCSTDATCTNTPGSFTCACKSGFIGNGFTCSSQGLTNDCNAVVDIVFLIDASDEGQKYFSGQKQFIKALAATYLRQGNSRASIVSYAFDPVQNAELKDYTDMATFMAAVDAVPLINGVARMDRALGTVISEFATAPRSGVPALAQIGIVLNTDGGQGVGSTQNSLGGSMRALGYKLAVVGLGPKASEAELLGISGNDKSFVLTPTTEAELISPTTMNNIQLATCPVTDVNECLTNPCSPNADCADAKDSFTCTCRSGYQGSGIQCSDINECLSSPCDANADCTNTVGSFTCACRTGFTGNGFTCADINECLSSPCSANADCTNTIGSFTCACRTGFTVKGFTCADINECLSSPCGTNADCTNTIGSFTCACRTGFTGNGFTCADINECSRSPCDANADCTNAIGSFTCACRTGFTGNGLTCADINECLTNPCSTNATCTNSPGSFSCVCNKGLIGDGFTCAKQGIVKTCDAIVDIVFLIDASDSGEQLFTAQKEFIKAVAGTYLTQASSRASIVSYAFDPVQNAELKDYANMATFMAAVDAVPIIKGEPRMDRALGTVISEFATAPRPGTVKAQIGIVLNTKSGTGQQNTQNSLGGSMRALGYKLALVGIGPAVTATELLGIAGGDSNFVLTPQTTAELLSSNSMDRVQLVTCPAVNECLSNPCSPSATCTDTADSFTCACNTGYTGNGLTCTDINECLSSTTNNCHSQATCLNTPGSYQCVCNTGYTGDGFTCTDINECLSSTTNNCHTQATCTNTPGSYTCACNTGYSGNGFTCADINECLSSTTNNCHAQATCTNTPGSYTCACNTGYTGNGFTCADINECLSSTTNNCHTQATCTNTSGSYTCACNTGYTGNGFNCADINECLNNVCHTQATCTNTVSSFKCSCNSGFTGDGIICVQQGNVKNCKGIVDLVFLIDASTEGAKYFDAQKQFIKAIAATYLSQGQSRAAIVSYAFDPVQNAELLAYKDMATFMAAVDGVSIINAEARMDRSLGTVISEFATAPRPGVTKAQIGIVLNAGQTNGQRNTQNSLGGSMRALGYKLVLVGVGNTVDSAELLGIAGNNADTVFLAPTTTELFSSEIMSKIQKVTCPAVNECLTNPCNAFATCTDTDESYTCACNTGYSGDGFTCVDINECLNNPCDSNAVCTNTPGSFTCACRVGFQGNGLTCTDVNECLTNPCHTQATCFNTVGSFRCHCNAGYRGNGFTCTAGTTFCNFEIDLVFVLDASNNAKDVFGREKDLIKTYASAFLRRPTSRAAVVVFADDPSIDIKLTDFKDLKTFTAAVDNIKYIGGQSRIDRALGTALSEFTTSGTRIGIDQVAIVQSSGPTNGIRDTAKKLGESIRSLGYTLMVAGVTQNVNKDELAEIAGGENENLIIPSNIDELLTDAVVSGFVQRACPEVNECLRDPCHSNANCADTITSYTCTCYTGYTGDGVTCIDINECLTNPCQENAICKNTPGSYTCTCKQGFLLENGLCKDINECLSKPCHENATCTNTPGSFFCQCNKGYEGDGVSCVEVRYRDWGAWSVCTVTCGGVQKRSRECSVSKIDYPHACPGASEEVRSCDNGCHIPVCPDHSKGLFYSFEDKHNAMVHGKNETWSVMKKTPTVYTGPENDHTFKSGCGHFMFFEASKCQPDNFGFVETPPMIPKASQYCLRFGLMMYADIFPEQMGSLTLYLFQYLQATRQVFHHGGITTTDRNAWREVAVDLFLTNVTMPFGVQFMAEQGMGIHSDVAIDDIALTPGLCTAPVDGNWGAWSEFEKCNATCGAGHHIKRRVCSSPPARNGGKPCVGKAEMAKPCAELPMCRITGVWSEWQAWAACSIKCDSGKRYRLRECYNVRSKKGDMILCPKLNGEVDREEIQWMNCSRATCRAEGVVGDWSDWSDCSVTCDYGLKYRSGKCSIIDGCNGVLTESMPCALRACYVNRQYGQWGDWSHCSTSCGMGKQYRTRYCPMVKGCAGESKQHRDCDDKCHMKVCPKYPIRADVYNFENKMRLIHTDAPLWNILQNQTYSVDVGPRGDATWQNYYIPKCGHYMSYEASRRPANDVGIVSTQLRKPMTKENCVTFDANMYSKYPEEMGTLIVSVYQRGHNETAEVKEIYQHKGTFQPNLPMWKKVNLDIVLEKMRAFSVVFKADRGIGYHSDISIDDIIIYDGLCPGPVDGKWSEWSEYGFCTVTCGGGVQKRTRKCSSRNGGKECEGDAEMTRACNEQLCPVNGSWCHWSPWNECTKSCGLGSRRRVRECTNPSPVAPGLACELPNGERSLHHEVIGPCNDQACIVNGNWGGWVESDCSTTCGEGHKIRVRRCENPAPTIDGLDCPLMINANGIKITHRLKINNETLSCNVAACP